jgi:dethiobiotin synthetase
MAAAGLDPAVAAGRVVPRTFEAPLAPVVAARLAGRRLESAEVEQAVGEALTWWRERAELMVVEGIGGLLTPLAEGTTVADLAIRLDYPLVVVARRALGTLNHTLLTVEAAQRRGLRLAGIVLNTNAPAADDGAALAEATNAGELARRLEGVAVLAELPFDAGSGPEDACNILERTDWAERARRPRHFDDEGGLPR